MMEWTEENNKLTINRLLDFYAELLAVYRDFALQNLDTELAIKLKTLQTLRAVGASRSGGNEV